MTNIYLEKLTNMALLRTIPPDYIKQYFQDNQFKIAYHGKNAIIHFESEKCSYLEMIISGKVVIERIDREGNVLAVAEHGNTDILGGNLLFSSNPYYPMTIRALTDVTLLAIEKELLFELCSSNRSFLRTYLELTSDNALLLGDKIKNYINRPLRDSIATYLKHQYQLQKTLTIQLPLTKKALAERIGVQRTSLSRELKKMKEEGLIAFDDKGITILKPMLERFN